LRSFVGISIFNLFFIGAIHISKLAIGEKNRDCIVHVVPKVFFSRLVFKAFPMKTRDRPKILCLGMSYPDVIGQMQHEGFKSGILIHDKPCVLQAVECVRRNILTEMDGRDLARCLAMEQKLKVAAYTVSQELGSVYLKSNHLHGNFNRASFVKALRNAFGESVRFRQILLDYFWIPQGTCNLTFKGISPLLLSHGLTLQELG
jgi:hypothetical protein